MKSDELILGDGDFTQSVLDEAKERLEERYRLQAQGYDLEKVTIRGRPANTRAQSKHAAYCIGR